MENLLHSTVNRQLTCHLINKRLYRRLGAENVFTVGIRRSIDEYEREKPPENYLY